MMEQCKYIIKRKRLWVSWWLKEYSTWEFSWKKQFLSLGRLFIDWGDDCI